MNYIKEMNRQALLYMMSNNPSLRNVFFDDNKIIYGNTVIDLGDFNLMTLLGDYSSLKGEIGLMTEEDIVNIIAVNVLGNEQLNDGDLRTGFYRCLNGDDVSNKDELISKYNDFIYDLMSYQDYVSSSILPLLDEFKMKLEEIELKSDAREIEKRELNLFYEMQEKALSFSQKFKNEKQKTLELTLPPEDGGYINSLIIVSAITVLGIILAFAII